MLLTAAPGDRVQMDVCKIGAGLYQYTAIEEFWPTIDLGDPELEDRLAE